MARLSEVLSDQADGYPFSESSITTTCLECDTEQTLDEATFDDSRRAESKYLCRDCGGIILIVSAPEPIRWEGRGYLLGKWVLRNPRDVVVTETHTGRPLRFVASPYAMD
jgi:hypothetical protein